MPLTYGFESRWTFVPFLFVAFPHSLCIAHSFFLWSYMFVLALQLLQFCNFPVVAVRKAPVRASAARADTSKQPPHSERQLTTHEAWD
jgi:hypothetical protein